METKKPWQSKTNWIALIVAISSFYPPLTQLISSNPETFASVVSGIFLFLRLITKEKIVIK